MSFALPFDPAAFAQTLLVAAATSDWETHLLNPIGTWQRPWLRRHASPESPTLYISTGIHGDEPAGPYAALELVRRPELFAGLNVILFPLLNPAGLASNTRENSAGIDLNRDYNAPKTDEIRSHVDVLRTMGRVDLNLCLHEDWEATGVYLYELNLNGHAGIARDILAAMTPFVPVDMSAVIDGFEADRGVIARTAVHLRNFRPDWPEAYYLSQHHTELGYTFETPSKAAPIEARVAAHVAGVQVAADFLRKQKLAALSQPKASLSQ